MLVRITLYIVYACAVQRLQATFFRFQTAVQEEQTIFWLRVGIFFCGYKGAITTSNKRVRCDSLVAQRSNIEYQRIIQ